jgi:hypothetical protein
MLVFRLIDGITQLFVTFKAELVAGELEIILVGRTMGIMAFDTTALNNGFVATLCFFGDYLRMTSVTNFIGISRKKLAVR